MIENTFLKEDFVGLINQIKGDEQALWGMMTVQHMVEHLSMLFVISNGKLNAPSYYPADSQARKKARFIEANYAFPRNFNPLKAKDAGPLKFDSLEKAKAICLKSQQAFFKHYQENPTSTPNHPVMGLLNFEEWQNFHEYHVKHHFAQFGLIEG